MSKQTNTFSTKNSYSQALFELAKESNSTNDVEEQVSSILVLIRTSKDIKEFIKDPTKKIEDQLKIINAISDQFKFNELLKKFLGFVVSKRRFFYIEKILKEFVDICSKKRGEVKAELISAIKLSDNKINNIKEDLTKNFSSKIKLNYKYDESLIGGLTLQIGSIMIDTSIKNKLQQIENRMIEA